MKQAFTLLELIVVITILAILWTIAFSILSDIDNLDEDCVMDNIEEIKEYKENCIEVWLYNCLKKAYEKYWCYENY